jgi:hypothetical protein
MISKETFKLLNQSGRRHLLATRRGELNLFTEELRSGGCERLEGNPDVEVKLFKRNKVHYVLARSRHRRQDDHLRTVLRYVERTAFRTVLVARAKE